MKHHALALLLLAACGEAPGTGADATTGTDSTAAAPVPAIDLAAHGMPLLLTPPDPGTEGAQPPAIVWKEETGTLEVRAGDHFGLEIREEPGDLARLKESLDRDLLKKNTVLQETPDMLLYRSEFPADPSLVFMHFYRIVAAGDRSFVVEDLEDKPFNQQDIEHMAAAVSPKPPA